jgi:transposase-like protein
LFRSTLQPMECKSMSRRSYSDDTKAAVMAELAAGQGVGKVAGEYKIPVGTVKAWKRRTRGEQPVATQKKEAIGDLLVQYLETNLRTLKAQSEIFADPEWLKKQSASEAGILHGVITDKTVRLLEALGPTAADGTLPSGD